MKKQIGAAILLAAMLSGTQAAAWNSEGIRVSAWAQAGVAAAYESGAVSAAFDLGADYTRPVTRGQLARMTVDLVLAQRQSSLTGLAGELGIDLEMVPLTPADGPDDAGETDTAPSGDNAAGSNTTPSGGNAADTDTTPSGGNAADSNTTPSGGDTAGSDTTPSGGNAADTDTTPSGGNAADSDTTPSGGNTAGSDTTPSGDNAAETDTAPSGDSAADSNTTPSGDNAADSEAAPSGGNAADHEEQPAPQPPLYGDPLDGGLPYVVSGRFSDTRSVYIEAAARLGIVNGADGLFRPDDLVSRAEAAAMMQRCMGVLGMTEANRQPQQFADHYDIPRWAVPSVKYISGRTDQSGQAIMGGTVNGCFSPRGNYTIEQAILSLGRMQSSLLVSGVAEGWRDAPGYDSVTLALTFGGDCTLGRGHNFSYSGSFDEMYDRQGAAYFFSGIPEFFDDDLTMVNFEGTLTTATAYANKTFVFKGRPEYAKILEAGSIDVVSVANNHSMDYLQRGFDDTVRYLSPYVAVSGYERMPVVTVKGIRIGFASNTGWSFDSAQKRFIENAVQSLRARGADLVVFNYHWGIERSYHSDATQRAIGRYCIDQGADLVIGHHPHVVQEIETYKGKQIAYSLGNLVFGGNHNPSDKNCLIYRHNFTLDLNSRQVTASSYQSLPYRVSSVSWRNDYHPVRR